MTVKVDGPGSDPEVHRWDGGVTWIAHPGEGMRRASHAVAADDGVVVVEPVDVAGLDRLLADLGPVSGVAVLADFHSRHAVAMARRHDVPVYVPRAVAHVADDVAAPVEAFDSTLPGMSFRAVSLFDGFPWAETALYDPESGTLVATETLVTNDDLGGPGERLAVTPYVRFAPPRAPLRGLSVERVLVGHGVPVLDDAARSLEAALANARTGALSAVAANLPYIVRAAAVAVRD